MLCGGISSQGGVTDFAVLYVPANVAEINAALHLSNESYHINAEGTQIVNGVNHFLHLTGSDGHQYTVTLFEATHPNHHGVIIEAAVGHHNFGHGYGAIVHHSHPHSAQHH